MAVSELTRGTVVVAAEDLDPTGCNVKKGTVGVVFEGANYHGDNGGPMVRWIGGGVCNVYEGDVTVENPDISVTPLEPKDDSFIFSSLNDYGPQDFLFMHICGWAVEITLNSGEQISCRIDGSNGPGVRITRFVGDEDEASGAEETIDLHDINEIAIH